MSLFLLCGSFPELLCFSVEVRLSAHAARLEEPAMLHFRSVAAEVVRPYHGPRGPSSCSLPAGRRPPCLPPFRRYPPVVRARRPRRRASRASERRS
jgi:hypothetical protein